MRATPYFELITVGSTWVGEQVLVMPKIRGKNSNDIFYASSELEEFDGLGGYDVIWFTRAKTGVKIDRKSPVANTGDAAGDTFDNIESFKLSLLADTYIGLETQDVVNGDAGNDRLEGNGGNDSLTGHSGNDTILGGTGNDAIWGGGGYDLLQGGAGNDQIWGDNEADTISGGADLGTITFTTTAKGFYIYSPTHLIPLEQIDDRGEWVVVPKRVAIENAAQLESIGRAGGDAVFAITNGFDDARGWNVVTPGLGLKPFRVGPSGEVGADSTVIFNAGSGNPSVMLVGEGAPPITLAAGSKPESTTTLRYATPTAVTFGDVLSGGTGADTFSYAIGDGVDRVNDFVKGVDKIDLTASLFDGNQLNGEYYAVDYAGGALIMFRDTSADGFADNSGIYLAGIKAAAIDASIFI